jgi:hypothetical protein
MTNRVDCCHCFGKCGGQPLKGVKYWSSCQYLEWKMVTLILKEHFAIRLLLLYVQVQIGKQEPRLSLRVIAFLKKRVCLPRWCDGLGLVTKENGLEILDYCSDQNNSWQRKVSLTLYYYVKVWRIIVQDYVSFNAFQFIQTLKKQKNVTMF